MTELFLHKILFMTELLIIEVLYTFRCRRADHFKTRAILAILICYGVAFLFPIPNKIAYTAWYSSMMFILLFICSFLCMKWIYRISWMHAFFCAIAAYTTQHLAYEVYNLIVTLLGVKEMLGMYGSNYVDFFNISKGTILSALGYLQVYLVVYTLSFLMMGKQINRSDDLKLKPISLLFITGLTLIVNVILNACIVYLDIESVDSYNTIICIYNVLCCLLLFYIQVSMIENKEVRKEALVVSQMLHQAKKQYELQQETIKLVNIKCHDIKHQLRQYISEEKRNEVVDEINEIVSIYDSTITTGLKALDIIFTEKSLLCHDKKIQMSCMASCDDLKFIKEVDLYSLFGNIIDNAIEAVSKLEDETLRCIGINIHTIGNFISIKVDNYYMGDIQFSKEGKPITSKENKDYHGYGISSIQAIVEKYNGSMSIKTEGNIFILNILFPIAK